MYFDVKKFITAFYKKRIQNIDEFCRDEYLA